MRFQAQRLPQYPPVRMQADKCELDQYAIADLQSAAIIKIDGRLKTGRGNSFMGGGVQ